MGTYLVCNQLYESPADHLPNREPPVTDIPYGSKETYLPPSDLLDNHESRKACLFMQMS